MMKKKILLLLAALIQFHILISSVLYPDGSPGGKTGSPLDGATCTQCHAGNVREASWITTNIPNEGWIPGNIYTIELKAQPDSANYIGFEITAESENSKVGTFILTDEERTRFTNNDKAVTHSHDGTTPTDGINIWQIDWKAPESDVGNVSFYAAFNAADGDATTSGDHIYASNISYDQGQNTAIEAVDAIALKVYPNPATNLLFIQSTDQLLEAILFDINGKQVKSIHHIAAKQTHLAVQELQSGLYILKVNTSIGEFTQRIQLK